MSHNLIYISLYYLLIFSVQLFQLGSDKDAGRKSFRNEKRSWKAKMLVKTEEVAMFK